MNAYREIGGLQISRIWADIIEREQPNAVKDLIVGLELRWSFQSPRNIEKSRNSKHIVFGHLHVWVLNVDIFSTILL